MLCVLLYIHHMINMAVKSHTNCTYKRLGLLSLAGWEEVCFVRQCVVWEGCSVRQCVVWGECSVRQCVVWGECSVRQCVVLSSCWLLTDISDSEKPFFLHPLELLQHWNNSCTCQSDKSEKKPKIKKIPNTLQKNTLFCWMGFSLCLHVLWTP